MKSRSKIHRGLCYLLVLQLVGINTIFVAVGLKWLAYPERALELFLAAIAVQVGLIVRTYRRENATK